VINENDVCYVVYYIFNQPCFDNRQKLQKTEKSNQHARTTAIHTSANLRNDVVVSLHKIDNARVVLLLQGGSDHTPIFVIFRNSHVLGISNDISLYFGTKCQLAGHDVELCLAFSLLPKKEVLFL